MFCVHRRREEFLENKFARMHPMTLIIYPEESGGKERVSLGLQQQQQWHTKRAVGQSEKNILTYWTQLAFFPLSGGAWQQHSPKVWYGVAHESRNQKGRNVRSRGREKETAAAEILEILVFSVSQCQVFYFALRAAICASFVAAETANVAWRTDEWNCKTSKRHRV